MNFINKDFDKQPTVTITGENGKPKEVVMGPDGKPVKGIPAIFYNNKPITSAEITALANGSCKCKKYCACGTDKKPYCYTEKALKDQGISTAGKKECSESPDCKDLQCGSTPSPSPSASPAPQKLCSCGTDNKPYCYNKQVLIDNGVNITGKQSCSQHADCPSSLCPTSPSPSASPALQKLCSCGTDNKPYCYSKQVLIDHGIDISGKQSCSFHADCPSSLCPGSPSPSASSSPKPSVSASPSPSASLAPEPSQTSTANPSPTGNCPSGQVSCQIVTNQGTHSLWQSSLLRFGSGMWEQSGLSS